MNAIRNGFEHFKHHAHWLKWPLAAGLLALLYVLNRDQLADLGERSLRWQYATIGFLLCGGSILLTFLRWYLLVWALEFEFRIRDAIRLGFLGYVSNYVGPGAVGGDAVKAVMLARRQSSRRTVAVATIFLDRILGLLALFLVGAFISCFQSPITAHPIFQTVAAVFWGGSVAGLVGLLVMLHPATPKSRWLNHMVKWKFVGPIIGDLINGILLYQSRARILWGAVLISIVGHFGMLSSFYFCGLAVNPTDAVPNYTAHLLFMPAAEIAAMVPIVPGGVGALEGAIAFFYEKAGSTQGDGFLMGITYRVTTIVIAALGTAYYFSGRSEIQQAMKDADKS
ncbi:MAG: lysylphosphatidylglycerol synthase transmembrane domain-containing protein [Planctomycetaceae bacterium]